MKFTIDRRTWYRGRKNSALIINNPQVKPEFQGYSCCLGHIAKQCGIPDNTLKGIATPKSLRGLVSLDSEFMDKLTDYKVMPYGTMMNSPTCSSMMEVNDNRVIEDKNREAELIFLAAKLGWTLEFIN